ncbi:MAG: hypothetical protein ACD_79C00590G0003 [uncultured bacterium]|nr:MAG: hypothetical protein ACD_79C00590G0003 [uncultured bacterium]
MRNMYQIKFIIIIFFFSLKACFALQDEVLVPVEVTVDEYFHLTLESVAINIDSEGKEIGQKPIEPGTLFFGDFLNPKDMIERSKTGSSSFSSSYKTITKAMIVNNSKPFQLIVRVDPEIQEKTILDIKTKENICALKVKTSSTNLTKLPQNIINSNLWQPMNDLGEIMVYDSFGDVVSDFLEISFALMDIDYSSSSGKYGGTIIWTLIPKN